VVTGTLLGGKIREGDEVALMPSGRRVKVRGIEVHGVKLSEARAPCRIALNLGGLEADARIKGRWIASPGFFMESSNLLALVEGMPWMKKELKLPARLSINIGSGIFQCRLFAGAGIRAGERVLVRISLEEPVIARTMDRFILRLPGGMSGGYSTVAGGVVVDPLLRSRKITERQSALYGRLDEMGDDDFICAAAALAGRRGISKEEMLLKAPSIPEGMEKAVGRLVGSGRIAKGPDRMFFNGPVFEEAKREAAGILDGFHRKKPELPGMKRDELRRSIAPPVPEQLFKLVLDFHAGKGLWKVAGDIVSRADFSPRSDEITGRVSGKIMALLAKNPSSPPSLKEIPGLTGESAENVQRALSLLQTSGEAKLVGGEFLYTTRFLGSFAEGVEKFFQKSDQLRVTDLKTIVEVSRKYALPLARWLDDEGITLRRGEVRVKKKSQ
jgi:selenocysteine-specific elongation factor